MILKQGLDYVTAPARRRVAELRIDALHRRLGLWHEPGPELRSLMRQAEVICSQVKNDVVLGEYFTSGNPWSDRPWRQFNYWNGWYALARLRQPARILEIGTAFGFSTMALARGAGEKLQLLVSLDLGNFGRLLSPADSPDVDNLAYVSEGISRYRKESNLSFDYVQFAVNTQPPPYTDNEGNPVECPYWRDNRELAGLLSKASFDMILVDGKHTGDGLYNDLHSFTRYGDSGSLIICDDIQHGDAAESLRRFVSECGGIADYAVWRYLRSNAEYAGTLRRDQGLILKK